ncbi:tetratricopeptide repeat protein [Bradyrhizobium canariense]|uniref:Localization factor PodJL n=1 Tax=Bradyrhizobium canariense TaxID=255045 RepID=A0A1H1Y3G5_9BRAD|nr:tetratricopeptide repeat protein [Bradyrhizobium canariense]SDT15953.1 localization factor PodJL [Bradyrhizobium canariense]
MNSRVSWSVDGIDPSVRERAEAAARRAGMSLSDWLNSTIGDSTPPDFRAMADQRPAMPSRETRDVADIHQRLDSITRQIEQISRPAPRTDAPRNDALRGEPAVARQLNDAISRLDARLSQISNPAPARNIQLQDKQRQTDLVERAAAQIYRPSPPLSPSLDSAIAEITARQSELDGAAPRPMPSRNAPPIAPAMSAPIPPTPAVPAGPDFSSLERHLFKITSQIEALQRPDGIEQSISAFRSELAEIRAAITEAMPRRAIESIENEIRSLSRRIDDTRQSGSDGQALAGIERALGEIREALRSLTPAEQLTGYDDAIRNLGAKLDLILRTNEDPSTVHQLESAIAALRSIVSNVASNDALARLTDDVRTLSAKVDQLADAGNNNDSFAILEQRLVALTSSLESRERPVASDNSQQLENAVRALSDRLDRMPVGNDSASAFAHLEQRVSYLLERLESSADHRSGNLGRVEDGLQDILRHLENQHASFATLTENSRNTAAPLDAGLADIFKRELSDIRFSQTERDRHTQDSLEAVHNTLGHVVDRLAMIEGDLRTVRSAPVTPPPEAPAAPRPAPPEVDAPRAAVPAQPKPELPNPAAAEAHFAAAPREFHAVQPAVPTAAAVLPKAISEILEPHAAPARATLAPELPPDHPLEPGTRPTGRPASPSERIAASENAISEISAAAPAPATATNFIAAARRAAQAAAAAPPNGKAAKPAKAAARTAQNAAAGDKPKEASTITSKIRSLLVGASVVVIVLGSFKMAMNLLDSAGAPQPAAVENSSEPPTPAQSPPDQNATPAPPAPAMPSMTAPTPINRQSFNGYTPDNADSVASATIPSSAAAPSGSPSDITGTIPAVAPGAASPKLGMVQVPPTERLPDAIGGPVLRSAALKGDPTAAYEIGVRYAEGKGVTANFDEAAKWYDRAAQAGVIPAVFRLGTLYEKGTGVQKDAAIARRYYMQAAERGNAKAMHNLAVLDADGGGNGANYKSAAQWFRKAADRGVADSQFNLGILYARGIGVEQNLAESFKWFSLAAAQGDADSARKRDDIAKRLDAQSLAAAKLAIQTFTPEQQPSDAINVATPTGGWDSAPVQAGAAKPAKPASIKRAAR